jgi:hypothetical protein
MNRPSGFRIARSVYTLYALPSLFLYARGAYREGTIANTDPSP